MPSIDLLAVREVLENAVEAARRDETGGPATYIPELALAPLDRLSAAITTVDGELVQAGDVDEHTFTLQSSAKLILLIGMLEELGSAAVFKIVGSEPSGSGFASLARLETDGPRPSNPLINPGAIALCGLVPGDAERRIAWVCEWAARICGKPLPVNPRVLASERRTGDRNRAIAYFLKASGILDGPVDETLEVYFTLCSLETDATTASRIGALLASGGLDGTGRRIVSRDTVSTVIALMATCGMYDESGTHLRETGLPAKSGVSGVIVAVALGRAGICVCSPRLNHKGGSVRGHLVLRELSRHLNWHLG